MHRQKRILVSWYTNPQYIPPFVLSDRQMSIGPRLKPEQPQMVYERFTPVGTYNLAEFTEANGLPKEFDAIVVWSDASQTNRPLGLGTFNCPKVLCVGDTHHMAQPLHKMLTYAIAERFDFIVSSHNRHHLHWFAEAGFPKTAWLPGIKIRHLPRSFQNSRKSQLAFIGNTVEGSHPRRNRVLMELVRSAVQMEVRGGTRDQSADLCADSVVSFNCSLNGDLNLRVFEILSAGGCLLTDRLSPQAGLDLILKEGKEFLGYDTAQECVDQTRYLLTHPEITAGIAQAGNTAFQTSMLPQLRASQLLSWVFDGRLDMLFRGGELPPRHLTANSSINDRVRVYEELQEFHRVNDSPRVLFLSDVPDIYLVDASDLRHLRMFSGGPGSPSARPRAPEIAQRCTNASRAQMEATEWDGVVVKGNTEIPGTIRYRQIFRTDQPLVL
jgi:hypothetical protein